MRRLACIASGVVLAAAAYAGAPESLETGMRKKTEAQAETFEWGTLVTYFAGNSYAATDSLTAVAIINPGMEIHPPHVHSEEEYLMVLEGEGTWSVKGETFPATPGDVLYAAPWDEHGIRNTGEVPLKFVVFKWNPKPVSPMPQPGR